MSENVEEKIVGIIRSISGSKKKISIHTAINHDLPINGDDAIELIEKIHAEFGTDFKEFKFDDYFSEEGTFLSFLKRKKKSLYVEDLIKSVQVGVWQE